MQTGIHAGRQSCGRQSCWQTLLQAASHAGRQACKHASHVCMQSCILSCRHAVMYMHVVMQKDSHGGKQQRRQTVIQAGSHAARLQTVMKAYKLADTQTARLNNTDRQVGK